MKRRIYILKERNCSELIVKDHDTAGKYAVCVDFKPRKYYQHGTANDPDKHQDVNMVPSLVIMYKR